MHNHHTTLWLLSPHTIDDCSNWTEGITSRSAAIIAHIDGTMRRAKAIPHEAFFEGSHNVLHSAMGCLLLRHGVLTIPHIPRTLR